jgi:hypothetical protein
VTRCCCDAVCMCSSCCGGVRRTSLTPYLSRSSAFSFYNRYKSAHAAIRTDPKPAAKKTRAEGFKHTVAPHAKKLTYDERQARIKAKLAKKNRAAAK